MSDDEYPKNGPLTLDQARELLRAVVAEHGEDFRYTSGNSYAACLYVTREYAIENWGWPSDTIRGECGKRCVVGTLLDLHGEEWHHREEFWDRPVSGISGSYPGDYFTSEAAAYLNIAQDRQDQGKTWGEALEAAEAWAGNYVVARGLVQDVFGRS